MADMTQHTPGPWTAIDAKVSTLATPSAIVAWINEEDPQHAGLDSSWVGCGGDWRSNARLIAAAPQMLEALRETIGALQDFDIATCDSCGGTGADKSRPPDDACLECGGAGLIIRGGWPYDITEAIKKARAVLSELDHG